MARQGRAGPALGIAALGSFFAGCASTLLIALAAPPLAAVALEFGPAEYFSLMVCGLVAAVVLARGSLVKAIAMVVLGLLLGLVGTDVNTGARRFNFGMMGLADGIEFVAISMAIYGIAEVVYNLEKKQETSVVSGQGVAEPRRSAVLRRLDPARHRTRRDSRRAAWGRRTAGVVRGLYAGEKSRQAAAPIRLRRHQGRRRAGIRQQCGRADVVHPDADFGDSRKPDHGDDDRGADDSRHRAGAARDDGSPRIVLGAHRQHVARQPHAGDLESADGRRVGKIAAGAVPAALSRHHRVLLHRRLHHQQQAVRRLRDGVLYSLRLCGAQARLRTGAAHSRFRARTDDGGKSAPGAADPARCSDGFPAGAEQTRLSRGGGRVAGGDCRPRHPPQARGGAEGIAATTAATAG